MKTRLSKVYDNMPKKKRVTKLSLVDDIDNFFSGAPDPAVEQDINETLRLGDQIFDALANLDVLIETYNKSTAGESWQPEGFYMGYKSDAEVIADNVAGKLNELGLDASSVPALSELESYIETIGKLKELNAKQNNQYQNIYDSLGNVQNVLD
tara:strand:- start:31 stop:489 length:459 start_codon:yes stop_codon:yes gene_type:complete